MVTIIPNTGAAAAKRPTSADLDPLVTLFRGRRIVALVGAGCSTDSGIPDYRGPDGSLRARRPIQYQEFIRDEAGRVRYWARASVGWDRIRTALPNRAHECLARLEAGGALVGLITQNVDGLHQKAGSRRVVELHGSLARVCCLACGVRMTRADYQESLLAANPLWSERLAARVAGAIEAAPDGDAEVPAAALAEFRVPPCRSCGGIVKPDVVFFGENVPPATVADAWSLFDEADALFVVGSSLTVYSGRRFIYRAEKEGVPIGVLNLGPTRADDLASVKVDGRLGDVLPALTEALLEGDSGNARLPVQAAGPAGHGATNRETR